MYIYIYMLCVCVCFGQAGRIIRIFSYEMSLANGELNCLGMLGVLYVTCMYPTKSAIPYVKFSKT